MNCMIGSPPPRPRMNPRTIQSAADVQRWILEMGGSCALYIKAFFDIHEGRNFVATHFLESEAETLISFDDDVAVTREAFETMLNADVPYIAAEIPQPVRDLSAFADLVRDGHSTEEAKRMTAALPEPPADGSAVIEVDRVGAGFFIARRPALQKLVDTGIARVKHGRTPQGEIKRYGFYDHVSPAPKTRLSGAYSFCSRLAEAEIPIHAYRGPGISRYSDVTVGA